MFSVAQQLHLEREFLGELQVARFGIRAYSDYSSIEPGELVQRTAEIDCFDSSATGVILGIEIQDDPSSFEAVQADFLTAGVWQTELGRQPSDRRFVLAGSHPDFPRLPVLISTGMLQKRAIARHQLMSGLVNWHTTVLYRTSHP